jgi:signal transduction histidine kinase
VKLLGSLRGRGRYTLYGALFGALFPLFSFLILTFVSRNVNFLFGVICTAPFFLGLFARFAGVRQDNLDRINRELEALVAERTRSIQGLLDVSGQGFLSFDRDFKVSPEFSRECENIFGGPIGGKAIDELLFPSARARNDFRSGLGLYFAGSAKAEVIFDLLDRTIILGQRTFRVEYRAVSENRVMAILTDITDDLRQQAAAQAENERRGMLLKVVANRRAFTQFNREAENLLIALHGPGDRFASLLRDIHSFKGNAGFFGFRRTQECAHALEDSVADALSLGQEVQAEENVRAVQEAFAAERGIISETLGTEWVREGDRVEVPRAAYLRLERHVKKHYPADAVLIGALESHRLLPLAVLFEKFPPMVKALAERMGKQVELAMSSGVAAVPAERFEPLVSSFAHILRNMVDHGIEAPADREAAGKPRAGMVRIDVTEPPGEIVFTLCDDGRGVSLAEVEKRGRELGLIPEGQSPSSAELLTLIFRDSFSTSRQVNSISGRGVGLPAVRQALRKLGGSISVRSTAGRGTTFAITVPRRGQGESGA